MPYKQTKLPNLDPVIYQLGKILYNWLGYCLAYVQTAFGAGWAGDYALDGWNKNTKFNHEDRNIPSGVYVPIWFTGYWNGFNYGHVAIYKDGKVWSSPYTNKPYADKLNSIEEVERLYGMKYLGWSEGIGGTRVVEYVNNNATVAQIKALYLEILERPADADGIKHYSTRTVAFVRDDLLKSDERKKLLANKEKARKAAEDAAKKAEAARIAAAKDAANKAKAEAARKAQEEADRLAEIERKKKEEQAALSTSWKDLADEQKKTNSLIQQFIDLIKKIFNIKE